MCSEEYAVSSFLYRRDRPFNPEKLHKLLDSNFMLHIINPDSDDEADDYDGETDEQYEARLVKAKAQFSKERAEGYRKMQAGSFKHLFRSKGFLWLANKPEVFFEWSQASASGNFLIGGPWLVTVNGESLAS